MIQSLVARLAGPAMTLTMLSLTTAAWAQETIRPPTPGKPENPGLVMQIVVAALGVGLVGGFFLIKAKRGHQD